VTYRVPIESSGCCAAGGGRERDNEAPDPTASHATSTTRTPLTGRKRDVITVLSSGPRSTAQIAGQLGVTPGAIRHHLHDLATIGIVAPTGNKRSPLNTWVLVQPDDRPPD